MWSTSVLGAVQPGHWQEGWAWRVRVRREAQGARWEGWAWSHRVCAEEVRFVWAGHRDDPEGVRREHPGWVHLVGGMVGVMAPAYPTGAPIRGGSPPWPSVTHGTTTSRAHAYSSLSLFLYIFFTLSLSLYKKEGSS